MNKPFGTEDFKNLEGSLRFGASAGGPAGAPGETPPPAAPVPLPLAGEATDGGACGGPSYLSGEANPSAACGGPRYLSGEANPSAACGDASVGENICDASGCEDAPAGFEIQLADVSWVKRKFLDVPYANASKAQRLDIYLPDEGEGPFPAVVHIHGGGFGMGDKRDDHMDTYLKGLFHGFAICSVEYRLSSEAIFPAAVLDCREAFRFLKRNALRYMIDPERICALGGSAGGNLAAIMGMNIPNGEFYGEEGLSFDGDCTVKAAVDQFGPMNFRTMDAEARANGVSFVDHDEASSAESTYMGGPLPELSDDWLAKADPASYISERMAPMLVEHGFVDRLVPFAQSVGFVNKIYQKLGAGRVEFVPLPNADHEDKEYSSDWNMKVLWSWLDKHLK